MDGPVARAWLIVPSAANEERAIKRLLFMSAPWECIGVWTWVVLELFKKQEPRGSIFLLVEAAGKKLFYLLAAAAGPWAP